MILVNYDPIVSDGVVYQLPIYCCHHDHSDVLLLLLFSHTCSGEEELH